ncbi:di-trans,poly-cis-decaprenylcistransferase [Candidatus Saccharibacteria bacterium]|nr:di-trans,poly-cis-decaprenylcistransferase [Candidatus Saccharibacteria bacterium]
MQEENPRVVPRHVGYILDGNRRWARQHSLPEYDGHLAGYNALKDVLVGSFEQGIQFVSIYAFSTENWQRDKKEVSHLVRLVMHAVTSDLKEFVKNGIRLRVLGHREGLSEKLVEAIEKAEEATRLLDKGTVLVCFNYGGQREIVDAARKCIEDGLTAEEITEEAIAKRLYAADVPPIDIIVRTSGEQRLSNFMLWRASYSELYFLKKYWPDMTKEDVADIIEEYNRRQRRFGA